MHESLLKNLCSLWWPFDLRGKLLRNSIKLIIFVIIIAIISVIVVGSHCNHWALSIGHLASQKLTSKANDRPSERTNERPASDSLLPLQTKRLAWKNNEEIGNQACTQKENKLSRQQQQVLLKFLLEIAIATTTTSYELDAYQVVVVVANRA